jgi:hypothetical protein
MAEGILNKVFEKADNEHVRLDIVKVGFNKTEAVKITFKLPDIAHGSYVVRSGHWPKEPARQRALVKSIEAKARRAATL